MRDSSSRTMDGGSSTVLISFRLPRPLLDELDRLVEDGIYRSRSCAIRRAIELLLARYRVADSAIH
ncbi:ribbon-helix-helix domain-containing protein [Thermoproteus uzoniensis]|uniref:ribbon-helix-helix domain-containing protein n=1 Tax=Thermoproteus uzoniensis TaxID=184117 RepID=UPI001F48E163|nr:ribbon-helix-helix domain-containing protein [Thermoproteus uzoniensis]